MRRVDGVHRAGTLTPHGLDQQPPPLLPPPPPPHLTLSDGPEAVKQGLLEDPLQAPQEGRGLSPEPWQLPQTWHPAQPFFSISDKRAQLQPQSLLPGEAPGRAGPCG